MIYGSYRPRACLPVGLVAAMSLVACSGDGGQTSAPPPVLALQGPDCAVGNILKPTTYELLGTVDGVASEAWFEVNGPNGGSVVTATLEAGVARADYFFERAGSYQIELYADTGLNTYASESPLSCAVANLAPELVLLEPANASVFNEESTITLSVRVTDSDDDLSTLQVLWSSARDGDLGTVTPGSDGFASIEVSGLTVFNHLLTARVSDPWGGAAEADVLIEVQECEDKDGDGATECSDCNDRDPNAYPGAEEICDGIDNDCNDEIDELGDADGDGFGQCVAGCLPGSNCVLDCDDTSAFVKPGAIEICDTLDNNCDGFIDEGFDNDQDGYSACTSEVDCNDSNPAAYPGRIETCDTVDNDCDGTADEGLSTLYYRDSDGDGYGDPENSLSLCTPGVPTGFTSNADDCDDSRASVFPGAGELCDGLDNNCDGTIDEGQQQTIFYADLDSDGRGDANNPVSACVQPEGAQSSSDDCNDNDASVYPGATEICDLQDQDCDSTVDEGAQTPFYADGDLDGYGDSAQVVQACAAPEGYVAQGGDCGPNAVNTYPGAAELCDTADNDCDTKVDEGAAETFYFDGDGDGFGTAGNTQVTCAPDTGYVSANGDCNDNNAGVYPNATETCEGTDQDCDSITDEGVKTTFYLDSDGDGYGDTESTSRACSVPNGYSAASGDCDDSTADSFPGATELCDGLDNDCNGELDNGLATTIWFLDGDGDSYGADDATVEACDGPPSYVSRGGDCKDANPAAYPGAPETCNSKDEDCDDLIDEGVKTTYYKDVDRDGYGTTEERYFCYQCDGCALTDDDCDDADPQVYPGAPELFDGADNDCDGAVESQISLSTAPASFGGLGQGSFTGASVAEVGDLDGDGLNDIAFGAPRFSSRRGVVYVVYGKTSGWANTGVSSADAALSSSVTDVEAGTSITGGDIDNDGVSDLIVGIPKFDSINGVNAEGGHVSLFYGGARLTSGDIYDLESNRVEGYFPQVNMGWDLDARGDVTCDGINDVIIGAPWSWTLQVPNPGGGAVFVLPGKNSPYSGPGGVGGGELIQLYGSKNDMLGQAVAFVGDAGGSSCGDFIANGDSTVGMGPMAINDMGRTYLISGGDSSDLPVSELLDAADKDIAFWEGSDNLDRIGTSLDGIGDVNGDGAPDFILGRGQNSTGEPLALLFFGGDPLPNGSNAESQANVSLTSNSGLRCPCNVGGLGDINSDGLNDFAVSVPGSSTGGRIFVFFGKEGSWARTQAAEVYADLIIDAEQAGDEAGVAIAGLGDVNGDGAGDFIIGARSADGVDTSAGKVYIFFGY